jgi:DNA polymerase-3 subunit gamma/tau
MAYEVTATRKRPRSFEQIVGQEFVVATLRGAIERQQIAHAFLFSGPRGVGKTSAARVLARSLNCAAGPTPSPCDNCNECKEISAGSSLDVIEIDGASNTGVDDVRAIKDEVLFPPAAARYKVYIIDEVHMLSTSAFNALLKTVEEPPPYVVFIFATTEIHKVPATIRSRCQQFTFRLFSTDEIRDRLAEVVAEQGLQADEEALIWIAKEADGSLRDAYTTFDQIASFAGDQRIGIDAIRDTIGALSMDELNQVGTLIGSDDPTAMLALADEIIERGVSVERFVIALADYLRSLLLLRHGVTRPGILGYPEASFSTDARARLTVSQLELAGELLLEVHRNLKQSVSPRFELELLLSRLARVTGMVTPDELLAEVHAIKGQFSGDGDGGGAPAKLPEAAPGPRTGGPAMRGGGSAEGMPPAGGARTAGPPPPGSAGSGAGPRGAAPSASAQSGAAQSSPARRGAAPSGAPNSAAGSGAARSGGATDPAATAGPRAAPEPDGRARGGPAAPAPVLRDGESGATVTAPEAAPAAADGAPTATAVPEGAGEVLHDIAARVRAQNQMTLAASVERAVAAAVEPGRVTVTFAASDRYHGGQVAAAQQVVAAAASEILGRPVRVGVDYRRDQEAAAAESPAAPQDADVGRFCKIFRGEVVKEIAHGI